MPGPDKPDEPEFVEHFDRDTGKSEMVDVAAQKRPDEPISLLQKRRPTFKHPGLAAPYGFRHTGGVIPPGTPAPEIISREQTVPRAAIRRAMKKLDEIEPFPAYEDRWPWHVRFALRLLGLEAHWRASHARDAATYYEFHRKGEQ